MFTTRLRGGTIALVGALLLATSAATAPPMAAQENAGTTPEALERHHPYLADLLDALEAADALVLSSLATPEPADAGSNDAEIYTRAVRDVLAAPAGAAPDAAEVKEALADALPTEARTALQRSAVFHRELLNIFADPEPRATYRDVGRLVTEYVSDSTAALPTDPKDPAILTEGPQANAFAATHPNLHGLAWAGRWLRLAAFEPLIRYDAPERRRAGVLAVVARFWSMLESPPESFPTQRPMAPTIAPALVDAHPDAAAVLDNAGMFRDVLADVMTSDGVDDARAEVTTHLERFRDRDLLRSSWYDWNRTAILRGVGNQGGWAIDIIPEPRRTEVDLEGEHDGHHTLPGMPVEMD